MAIAPLVYKESRCVIIVPLLAVPVALTPKMPALVYVPTAWPLVKFVVIVTALPTTLYEAGSFSNASYGFSSVAFSSAVFGLPVR